MSKETSLAEKKAYERYQESPRIENSVMYTATSEAREKGKKEERETLILRMHTNGLTPKQISDFTQIPLEEVRGTLKDL